jgi:hypothetical protein
MTRRKRAIDEHYVRKASDETVSNSTTVQSDDEILFPVGVNETWIFTIFLLYSTSGVADFKHQFSVPSGTAGRHETIGGEAAIASPLTTGGGASSRSITGVIRSGSTAGNITLQWAQNTAEVSDTKVLADSVLTAHRVA